MFKMKNNILPELSHERCVALEEEVDRELLQEVGDVAVGRDVVDQGLHLSTEVKPCTELSNFVDRGAIDFQCANG